MNQPSFYAQIPANVRYNKKICSNAKLLYGEITALTSWQGYCWATNKYFAELYDVDISSIKRWIQSLKNENLIFVEVKQEGIQTKRKIWISEEIKKSYTEAHFCAPPSSLLNPGGLENEPPIITSSITYEKEPPPTPPLPRVHPPKQDQPNGGGFSFSIKLRKDTMQWAQENFSHEQIKAAEDKTRAFKGRRSNDGPFRAALEDPEKWVASPNKEEYVKSNAIYLESLEHLDTKQIGNTRIDVSTTYIAFISGQKYEQFIITQVDFREKVEEFLKKLKLNL